MKCNRIIHANVYRASLARMNVMINPFGTLTNPQPKKSKRNPTDNILPTLFLHVATIMSQNAKFPCTWDP